MRVIRIFIFVLALMLVVLAGCERTVNETRLIQETSDCFSCHSDQEIALVAARVQYDVSVHATGGNFERNTSGCSQCHTAQGFVTYLTEGELSAPENPAPIGCFTCHAPHTVGDLSLRTIEPVSLLVGGTFDQGLGNLCANCHQLRVVSPDPNLESITITNRFGGHHGPQANVLSGNGGYSFDGEEFGHGAHANVPDGCVTCHMAPAFGDQAGGHTWNMAYVYHDADEDFVTGCNSTGCHTGVEDFSYEGVQEEVETKLATLKGLLVGAGLLSDADAPIAGTITGNQGKAIYNYLMILEDRSNGIHNPEFANDVLDATIAFMAD